MGITIYPWDLKAWRAAFRVAGFPGIALFSLLLGAMLQVGDITGGGAGHSSTKLMLLVRAPALLLAFLVLLYRPRIAKIRANELRFAYASFALLYFASALWSEQRFATVGKSAELLLAGVVFLEVSSSENPLKRLEALRQIILLTMSSIALVTVAGFLLRIHMFVQPRPGIISQTTAQAPFLSGNGLGYVSSALFLVVLAEWQAHRLETTAAMREMVFALALFSLSASRTSFGILLLTILIVMFKRSKILAAMAIGAVSIGGWIFWSGILTRLQGHQRSEDFMTLSGRTVVWTAASRQFELHPLLGVGGGVGGKEVIGHIGNMYLEQMSSLHNGFLELLTGLGLVGFAIGTSMLILATLRSWKAWETNPEYGGTYVLIVHVWMTTIMSTGILGWMGYEVALFLCIITNVDLVRRRAQMAQVVAPIPAFWPRFFVKRKEPQLG
ncbi:MAG TPA: O-antigen ligase family protein [Acidisarcina sp.]|nr:O-antigen ligase family protein [Acidisarcina sp.]